MHGASQALEEERRVGEKHTFMISVWVFFGSQISLILTLFCSLLQLCFLIFSPQDVVWHRKLFKTSQTHPANWDNQSP